MARSMFGGGSYKHGETTDTQELSNANSTIAKGTAMTGDFETVGTIRVEGKVFGNVKCKSKAILGEGSFVQGNILAQNAEIAGEVEGTVKIVDTLTLKATALINGDMQCGKLIVEPGAKFNGNCDMSKPVEDIKIGQMKQSGGKNVISSTKNNASNEGTKTKQPV